MYSDKQTRQKLKKGSDEHPFFNTVSDLLTEPLLKSGFRWWILFSLVYTSGLYVKPEMHYIAVFHNIFFAFDAKAAIFAAGSL